MRKAKSSDKSLVVDILSKAFDENKSVNYVVKQGKKRRSRIMKLMEYSFNVCHAFGEVWISDHQSACALVLFPDLKKTTLRSILWDAALAFSVIGITRVSRVLKRESIIRANHPKTPISYLWFIGVEPDHQHKGAGSNLLIEIIERSARRKRPIYLETSVEKNLSWYTKFGFEVFHSIDLAYKLYLLRKSLETDDIVIS